MEGTQGLQGFKIALLIDFDNVILGVEDPGFDVELVVNALRSRGSVVMGRAYGDWYRHNRHRRKLMEHGIELVETPVFGPVIKNSADIRIVLDGFEIAMLQHHIDAFCLVSGDSDFLPLIKKLQYLGKHVIVISGNKFTSDLVRRNCNEFISYENLLAESLGATEDVSTLEGAFALLSRGISTLHERGMEVRSSTVKQMMLQLNPAFSERNFGCAQFKQFLDKAVRAGIVKLGGRDGTSGEFMVFLPTDFEGPEPTLELPEPPVAPAFNGKTDFNGTGRDKGRDRDRRRRRDDREDRDERHTDTPHTEATPETPALDAEPAAPAEATPTAETSGGEVRPLTSGNLLSRGLRRGRLRFSGKAGRAEQVTDEQTETTPVEVSAEDATPQATPESIAEEVAAPVANEETSAPDVIGTPEAAMEIEAAQVPEDAEATSEAAPAEGASEDAAPAGVQPSETEAQLATEAPAEAEASPEALAEAEAAPKKRVTRRGGKAAKAKAAKSKAKKDEGSTEPTTDVADAAMEIAEESPAKARKASAPAAEAPSETVSEASSEPAEPVAETPAAPNPVEVGLAAADAKPARRRSTGRRYTSRKKTEGGNSENAA